ncbi:MAG: CDP-glycerol glycerophosphotransferase family protein [Eubacteriaceae bacterium]|nr:CDP-glycerol glycerophosphotransferase family protein [Eubacteriaceae bacterium]
MLKSTIKKIILENEGLRIVARTARNKLKQARYVSRGLSTRIDDKLIVFSAYNGKNYTCSPRAVYERLIADPAYSDYLFVWFFEHPEEYRFLEENINTKVVKNQSALCEKYLHRAKYWIFNFRALDHWWPSKEQVYVQCWHGTPLKRLGYDITSSNNAMNSIKEIREKYRTDTQRFSYLVSSCRFVTEKFSTAWHLKELKNESALIETGYPRNDFLSTYQDIDIVRIREKLGLSDCHKKILLYAPTWRDNQHDSGCGYVYDNPVDFDQLKEKLAEDYIILFRAHYLVANKFNFAEYEGFVYNVSDYDDINDLYVISDMLITDYSSVFFDYAILERPMFFYMYDLEDYRDELRGFYIDVDSLPGPVVKTEAELIDVICNSDEKFDVEEVRKFNEVYNTLNDGHAAERLIERVIK